MFNNPNEAIETFAIAYAQKVIIVDEQGTIVKTNADLFSNDIKNQINQFLYKITQSFMYINKQD